MQSKFRAGRLLLLTTLVMSLALLAASCGDDNPVEPENQAPFIKTFVFSPANILILDSTTLVWNVERADSLRIVQLDTTIKPVDSGRITLLPDSGLTYTGIAYNQYGRDTVTSSLGLTVVPFRVQAKSGSYFRAEYGSNVTEPPLTFTVSDSTGRRLADTTVYFSIVTGDGTLAVDSGITDANGEVTAAYEFTGDSTQARLRASFAGVDSADVFVRVNTLRFYTAGANDGQAQCVRFSDTYKDIVNYNGPPDSIAHTVGDSAVIAEYDGSLGVVVVIWDSNDDGIPDDTSSVLGAAVVDSIFPKPGGQKSVRYEGTDQNGIGIGSDYNLDIFPTYGNPRSIKIDYSPGSTPDSSVIIDYGTTLKAWFWCFKDTSSAFEIDMYDFEPLAPSPPKSSEAVVQRALQSYRQNRIRENRSR